jgi:hypothetical protein
MPIPIPILNDPITEGVDEYREPQTYDYTDVVVDEVEALPIADWQTRTAEPRWCSN